MALRMVGPRATTLDPSESVASRKQRAARRRQQPVDPEIVTLSTAAYRLLHILVKHEGSARLASWRDPHGKRICERPADAASEILAKMLDGLHELKGYQRAELMEQLATEVSDCGSARDGGGGDLGVLKAGDMDEAFEEAVFGLPIWGLSDVLETESGSHIVLRVPTDYSRTSGREPAAEEPVRLSHILIKFDKSARLASWRDPDGVYIRQRSRADAAAILSPLRDELLQLRGKQRMDRFVDLAREVSDCGSARHGGDLGKLWLSELDPEIAAVIETGIGELSTIVETDSGLHIMLRTKAEQQRDDLRILHVLVKHEGSARPVSWRDPEGTQIRGRTRDDAERQLQDMIAAVHALHGVALAEHFASLATEVSDCGSARDGGGGDLGVLKAGDMDEAFEEAVFGLPIWGLSDVLETESGSHIVLRVPTDYAPNAEHPNLSCDIAAAIQTPEMVAFRSELRGMKLGELKSRARCAGVSTDRIEAAVDDAVDDPKSSMITLILTGLAEMRDKLTTLRMGEVKTRAVEQVGISTEVVNAIIDEAVDSPKTNLIELIMERAMHPLELDPEAIEQTSQAMEPTVVKERTARVAAEDAERIHADVLQAAVDAAKVAEKQEHVARAATAAAAQEEAEETAVIEEEAVAAEADAGKELEDMVETECIVPEATIAGGNAEQIAKAEADSAREREEGGQVQQVTEQARAEPDEAMRTAERQRAEALIKETMQAELDGQEVCAQETEANGLADEENVQARDKAAMLDEATAALTNDNDGAASGEPDVPRNLNRITADDMNKRFGWRCLYDAISSSAPWDILRKIVQADPISCAEVRPSDSDGVEGMLPLHALFTLHRPAFIPTAGMRLRARKRPLGHRNMSGDTYYPCDVLAVSTDGKTMTVSYPDEGKRGIEDDALPVELVAPECVAPKGGSAAQVPVDLVQQMIAAHPAACQTKDSLGFVPVHYAMKNGASVDVVRALRFTGSPTMVHRHKEKVNRAVGKIRTLRQTNLLTPSLSNLGKALQMEKAAAEAASAAKSITGTVSLDEAAAQPEATSNANVDDLSTVVAVNTTGGRQLSAAEKIARVSARSLVVVDEAQEKIVKAEDKSNLRM